MSDASEQFLERVFDCVAETERDGLLTDRRKDGLTGISGLRTVGLLQRLAQLFSDDTAAAYVEIGVYQGLTLLSAALAAPNLPCFGIDNFRILDPGGTNLDSVNDRIEQFSADNATLLNMDFEDALVSLDSHLGGRRIAVYFVDGPHDYRSQMVCLLAAKRHLRDRAVIVVDDANYMDVRRATHDFLTGHPGFRMMFEAYGPAHPANLSREEVAVLEEGWLNGVHVLVRDPDGTLPEMLPPVDGDRTFYFNEWLTHRLRLAELAPEALALADAVCAGDGAAEAEARQALSGRYNSLKGLFKGRFADRNTDSGSLTSGRFNRRPG
jgi:hypothetical protein